MYSQDELKSPTSVGRVKLFECTACLKMRLSKQLYRVVCTILKRDFFRNFNVFLMFEWTSISIKAWLNLRTFNHLDQKKIKQINTTFARDWWWSLSDGFKYRHYSSSITSYGIQSIDQPTAPPQSLCSGRGTGGQETPDHLRDWASQAPKQSHP